jgi:hypothetical protein
MASSVEPSTLDEIVDPIDEATEDHHDKPEEHEEQVELDEDGHADVASAMRQCKTVIEDAQEIMSKLQSMSPEDSLPTWWSNKLAVASNNMNKMRDYIVNPIDEEVGHSEEEELNEKMDAFDRGIKATMRGGKTAAYIQKKAKDRADLNRKNDPSMARRGYALSVTDRVKAMKKARKRGLEPKYPTQKFGKRKLPEEVVDESFKEIEAYAKKHGGIDKNDMLKVASMLKKGDKAGAVKFTMNLDTDPRDLLLKMMKEESYIEEKTLTPAEKKKREEIAQAIARDDPKMPMDKKMAIATATAKRVAESDVSDLSKTLIERAINRKP